jgi:hypothetical protein
VRFRARSGVASYADLFRSRADDLPNAHLTNIESVHARSLARQMGIDEARTIHICTYGLCKSDVRLCVCWCTVENMVVDNYPRIFLSYNQSSDRRKDGNERLLILA